MSVPTSVPSDKSAPAHTPGLWTCEQPPTDAYTDPDIQLDESVRFWIVGGPVEEVLAEVLVYKDDGTTRANAYLIAAAPELLDALRVAVDVLRQANGELSHAMGCPRSPGHVTGDCQCIKAVIHQTADEAAAAVAKAEGRS